ncbi:20588_t:CDS:1, partial [Racocetra persica]
DSSSKSRTRQKLKDISNGDTETMGVDPFFQNQHGTTLKKRRLNELSHDNIAAIDCSESSIHDKKLMIKNGILCFKQSQDQKLYASGMNHELLDAHYIGEFQYVFFEFRGLK